MPEAERKLWLLDGTRTEADVIGVVDSLAEAPRLALDLEADSFHRYAERICLLQVGSHEADVIFDPVTRELTPPMRALLTSPDRTWILHGGDSDVLSLKRDYQLELGKLFDTHVAARFLGFAAMGLHPLLARELEVVIGKGEQRSDWRRRPLSAEQIRYAAQDVAHLLPLADRLSEHLGALGRLEWVLEECDILRRRVYTPKPPDPEAWQKLKGAKELGPSGQNAVRALFDWRDRTARALDRAAFRVVSNETIVAIVAHALAKGPPRAQDLRHTRGVRHQLDVAELAELIRVALAEPPRPLAPRQQRGGGALASPAARDRAERLRKARLEWAAGLAIDPALVLPPALIDSLASSPPESHDALRVVPGMTRWRSEAVGAALWNVLRSG